MPFPDELVVGLISDTHGLLRAEAVYALKGSDFIIHAGDVGDPAVLRELSSLAPVTAVRGNVDRGSWASSLPETEVLSVGAALIYALHDISQAQPEPRGGGLPCGHFRALAPPGAKRKRRRVVCEPRKRRAASLQTADHRGPPPGRGDPDHSRTDRIGTGTGLTTRSSAGIPGSHFGRTAGKRPINRSLRRRPTMNELAWVEQRGQSERGFRRGEALRRLVGW